MFVYLNKIPHVKKNDIVGHVARVVAIRERVHQFIARTVVGGISIVHDVLIHIVRCFVPFHRVAVANCSQCQAHQPTHDWPFHVYRSSYAFDVCHSEWPPHSQCGRFQLNYKLIEIEWIEWAWDRNIQILSYFIFMRHLPMNDWNRSCWHWFWRTGGPHGWVCGMVTVRICVTIILFISLKI